MKEWDENMADFVPEQMFSLDLKAKSDEVIGE
jgi:hypothetical protein